MFSIQDEISVSLITIIIIIIIIISTLREQFSRSELCRVHPRRSSVPLARSNDLSRHDAVQRPPDQRIGGRIRTTASI